MDYWNLGYFVLRAIVFVLTCLTLGIALSRARGHVAWLLPSCIGQALSLCGSLVILAYSAGIRNRGYSGNPLQWLLVPQQILFGMAMLCVVWSAVALYQTMQRLTAGAVTTGRGQYPASGPASEDREVWPPPPSQ